MHEWAAVCWWAGAEVGGQVARNSKNKEEGGGEVVRVRRGGGHCRDMEQQQSHLAGAGTG